MIVTWLVVIGITVKYKLYIAAFVHYA
jgi:hypothetical protein